MFFKCTNCQATHEPPLPPAQSSILSHCPLCGSPVTMIVHDTERPPPLPVAVDPKAPPPGAASPPSDYCHECSAPVWRSASGLLMRVDHEPDCSRNPERVEPDPLQVIQ
jgi:hypothetical protein